MFILFLPGNHDITSLKIILYKYVLDFTFTWRSSSAKTQRPQVIFKIYSLNFPCGNFVFFNVLN